MSRGAEHLIKNLQFWVLNLTIGTQDQTPNTQDPSMPERISFITHRGKAIMVIDFSHSEPEQEILLLLGNPAHGRSP